MAETHLVPSIIETDVLDHGGMHTLLEAIFQIIENNYVRKSVYQAQIDELNARLNFIEDINNILDEYSFDIDDATGDLTLLVPDDAYDRLSAELYIGEDDNLYLDVPADTLTVDESALAAYNFDIVNKDLILTI